jgi:CBS domain-containing protein
MLIVHVLRDKGHVVHTLPEGATLLEAAQQLYEKRVGALVVLDHNSAPAGVISERDIVRELARHGERALSASVADAMSRGVITATPNESIDECLARMTDRRIRHLPVIEDGRLAGVVSIGDLVKHRIAAAEAEAAAMQAYITTH